MAHVEYLRATLDLPEGQPGIVMAIHTFGEYMDFHPHAHALIADGLFRDGVRGRGQSRNLVIFPTLNLSIIVFIFCLRITPLFARSRR